MCRSVIITLAMAAALCAASEPKADGLMAAVSSPLMSPLPEKCGLRVARAALRVRVVGHWAALELELDIANGGEKECRENMAFTLPQAARVLGFSVGTADGAATLAVPVPDGLPEAVEGEEPKSGLRAPGQGSPWIFSCPLTVPSSEMRRLVFRYAEPMSWDEEGNRTFCLPKFAPGSLPGLSVDFQLTRKAYPLPFETPAGRVEFFPDGAAYAGHLELDETMLRDELRLRFPPSVPAAGVEEYGGVFYAATSWRLPEPPVGEFPAPETVGLVWDASASMRGRDRSRALAFLREYLSRAQGRARTVRLVVLRHEAEPARDFLVQGGRARELEAYLQSLVCDGATGDLRAAVASLRPAGLCFVYTDGKGTFGDVSPENPGVPAYALMPEGAGPTPSLARISAIPIDLSKGDAATQVDALRRPPYRVRSVCIDGRDWLGVATTALGGTVENSLSLIGTVTEGKHFVEAILTSGDHVLVLEQEFQTENAVPGDMLKARYAYLLATQAELQPDVLSRRRAQQAIRELFQAAVPGYHWELPSGHESEEKQSPPSGPDELAANIRRWRACQYENRTFGARMKNYWNRAAGAVADAAAQAGHEDSGEIATGKMPAWLRDDESAASSSSRNGKKRRASASRSPAEYRRKVYLARWNENAPYLGELKRADHPAEVYAKLAARHARCPGFFVDCSYFFSLNGDHAMAVRVISNLAEIEPDYLPLQTALAMRLLELEEYERARACLLHILARKEDAVQAYWLLAYLEGRQENWEQAAEYLVRLLRVPRAAEGLIENALVELNRLDAVAKRRGRPLRAGLVNSAWKFPADADLRVVLLWDSFDSDIDLEVVDPAGERCDSENETSASGGWRSRDITLGLGAESFMIRSALPGKYELAASVFGPRDGPLFAPVHLCLLKSLDYGRPGERNTSAFFQMESRNGGLQLGSTSYDPPREERENEDTPADEAGGAPSGLQER